MIEAPDLLEMLRREATNARDDKLEQQRALALGFYHGDLFDDDDPGEGRSKLVTRDVAETVDYMKVSVLRTVISGDRVVEFEARTPDGIQSAQEATETVTTEIMRRQRGYHTLSDFLMSGLLEKTGVVKVWAEPTTRIEESVMRGVDLDQAGDVIEAVETGEADVDEAGGVHALYAVRRSVEGPARIRMASVPNEEFTFSPDARSLGDAFYIAQVTRVRRDQLVAMGFDADDVAMLGGGVEHSPLSDARDRERDGRDRQDNRSTLQQSVELREEYILYDLDGDGIEERVCVHRVGDRILSAEPVDDQPFVTWCPFPMPHRIVGLSLADKVLDIQVTRSVLLRGAIDNIAYSNVPRVAIDMSTTDVAHETIDDVMHHRPGVPVRYKGTMPQPWAIPFTAGSSFQAMEVMAGERESRTGITRLNQGLDADTLNKTATGTAMMQAQGQQIEEYIARNFAQGLAEVFEKVLGLMMASGARASVRIDGEFREVNASRWTPDMDVSVRVGLGSGRKEQRLSYRTMLLGFQREAMQAGSILAGEEQVYNNLKGICGDVGLGDVNQFFVDPGTVEQGEKDERSPEQIEAEGKIALEQQRQAFRQEQAAFDARLREEALAHERQLAEARAEFEADMAERKFAFEQSMAMARMGASGIPAYRPGGDLAA